METPLVEFIRFPAIDDHSVLFDPLEPLKLFGQ
jgi:hypothetical protein